MKKQLFVLSTGLALFSMFFGSGNLVFPLLVGQESQGHFLLATLGICLTGVLMPFLGVIAMMLFKGNTERFFSTMGKGANFWFPLIALSLMGPFGVLARCITVAHGSFALLFPSVSLPIFSAVFCLIIFFICLNKSKMVSVLGSYLTPFLLLALTAIFLCGFLFGSSTEVTNSYALGAFQNGFLKGYQIMDLLAAFFFSTVILAHMNERSQKENGGPIAFRPFFQATLIGGGLLSLVYFSLVFLGATYSQQLVGVPPQALLGVVAKEAMGVGSAPFVCMAIVLACLTTAVVLANLFADFFKEKIARNYAPAGVSVGLTLVIAFFVSTLDFVAIASFLGPIVEAIYPALIVLTLVNIASEVWGTKQRKWPVFATLAAKTVMMIG